MGDNPAVILDIHAVGEMELTLSTGRFIESRARIARDIEDLANYGAMGAGVTRLAYTRVDAAAHNHAAGLMNEAGLCTTLDAIGNLSGTWWPNTPGGDNASTRPGAVMIGCHLDTVPEGGRFDGAAGFVVGLEALRRLQSNGHRPVRPLEIIVFRNEEGVRWGSPFTGSRSIIGELEPEELEKRIDDEGTSMAEAMRLLGLDPSKVRTAARPNGAILAYLEVHIEQGPVLENQGLSVGIVTGIAGPAYLQVTVDGRAGHAGAMPMSHRRDALAGAAELILAVEEVGKGSGDQVVATVGKIRVFPGAPNVVPGKVQFIVDHRSLDARARNDVAQAIRIKAAEVGTKRMLDIKVELIGSYPPMELDKEIIDLLSEASRAAEIPVMLLPSGGAHDAVKIAKVAPAGMLFVRSFNGISHSPEEFSSNEDLADAAAVLEQALLKLAF